MSFRSTRSRGGNLLDQLLRERGGRWDSEDGSEDDDEDAAAFLLSTSQNLSQSAQDLLVVFDMDHTMVGDLVSLSDRDNVETNMPWSWWPEGKERGLSPSTIVPYLQRGMMRPGIPELLAHLRLVGATIVVYTHSEDRWAVKVCQAMERLAGWPFIHRVFSRMDCKDGHPEFKARKSLAYIVDQMKSLDGLDWADVNKTIMFDDDSSALSDEEKDRLVTVVSYDYWAKCPWDENVNEEMLARNPDSLADIVRASVVEWGIAPPSYTKVRAGFIPELTNDDIRWARKTKKKESIYLAFNQVAQLDRVMYDVLDSLMDLSDLKTLPQKVRVHLANQKQPESRRVRRNASMSSMSTSSGGATPISEAGSTEEAKRPEDHHESPAKAAGPSPLHPAPGAASGPETLPFVVRTTSKASRNPEPKLSAAAFMPSDGKRGLRAQNDLRTLYRRPASTKATGKKSYEVMAPGPVSVRSDSDRSVSPDRLGHHRRKGSPVDKTRPRVGSREQIKALLSQNATLIEKLSQVSSSTSQSIQVDRSKGLGSGPRRSMAQ